MKLKGIFAAAGLLAAGGIAFAVTNPVSNPGFETGNISGWSSYVNPSWPSYWANASTGLYHWNWTVLPTEGSYFGYIESAQQGEYQKLWQTVSLNKKDVLSGYCMFAATDYVPYYDDGAVYVLSGGSTGSVVHTALSASVATVGSYGSTGWTYWEYEAPSAGTYTILGQVRNIRDSGVDSFIGLDGTAFEPGLVEVTLDIKPGSTTNPVNTKSKGVIPVAVLGTADFDVYDVDVDSLAFGPGGAAEDHGKGHYEDVNGDGYTDLVLHFDTQASGLSAGDTSATLTGVTTDGLDLTGTDVVSVK